MNTRISQIANALVKDNSAAALVGIDRLESINNYYSTNKLVRPDSLTFKATKATARLTKDEKNAILTDYIAVLEGSFTGSEEDAAAIKDNYLESKKEDGKVTFVKTYTYTDALQSMPHAAVAARLVDMLSPSDNEKYTAIRRKETAAMVDVDSIPELVKALNTIYEDALKERATANTATK